MEMVKQDLGDIAVYATKAQDTLMGWVKKWGETWAPEWRKWREGMKEIPGMLLIRKAFKSLGQISSPSSPPPGWAGAAVAESYREFAQGERHPEGYSLTPSVEDPDVEKLTQR